MCKENDHLLVCYLQITVIIPAHTRDVAIAIYQMELTLYCPLSVCCVATHILSIYQCMAVCCTRHAACNI